MPYLRKPVAILLLVWYLPACATSFQPTDLSPQEVVAQEYEIKVKVRDGDRTETVHLYDPWATSRSIGGRVCDTWACRYNRTWTAPLSRVESLETRQPDAVKAVAGTVLGLAVVAGVVFTAVVGAMLNP